MGVIGIFEILWLFIFLVLINIPVYFAYRSHVRKKKSPKIWAAILLSIFPSPVSGILYTSGIIPALISLLVFFGVLILNLLFMILPLKSLFGLYLIIMVIIAGSEAKNKKDTLLG